MAGFDPRQYDQQSSQFGGGSATKRGTFAQYLGGDGSLGDFAAQMQGTFRPPTTTNAQEEQAFGDQGEAQNMQQWGENLDRINQQHGKFAELGFGAVNAKQQWAQAKEMAQQQASASQQGALFSGISSGIGLLGGIASSGFFGGSKPSGATYTMPSASGWTMGSSMFGR